MPFHCDSNPFEIAPTKNPSAMAYTGPRNLARWGLKYRAITAMKPTITPIMATTGNVTFVEPSGWVVVAVVANQPTAALANSSTNSAAVAVIEPLTVITPRHGV